MSGMLVHIASRNHTGCSECRRKKVKCCRNKPVCTRCRRFPRLCTYDTKIVPWTGKTLKTVRFSIQPSVPSLPKHITHSLSCHLTDDVSRFYIHHFSTQTAALLFPLAPLSFGERLISFALDAPSLLYALLAASCSHHARLVRDPWSHQSALRYTNFALSGLKTALADQKNSVKIPDVASAIVLCTNDACNGNPDSFYTHLSGAKHLLQTLVAERQSENHSPFVQCLAKWFATLDVCASVSGSYRSVVSDGRYSLLETLPRPRLARPDELCGYALDLMPSISRIGRLASMYSASYVSSETMGEILELETHIKTFYRPDTLIHQSSPATVDHKEEMRNTNNAFASSALLHLYRRVYHLPMDHHMVRSTIRNILRAVENLATSSTTIILLLWPIFTAGCETADPTERKFIDARMQHMESFGLGNFNQARVAMNNYWLSGTDLTWAEYLQIHGPVFVLF